MTKKKKAPAAQQLINSLLNDSKRSGRGRDADLPSFISEDEVKKILPDGETPFSQEDGEIVMLPENNSSSFELSMSEGPGDENPDLVPHDEISSPFLASQNEDSKSPFSSSASVPEFSIEDEGEAKSPSFALESNTAAKIEDPVAKAERTAREERARSRLNVTSSEETHSSEPKTPQRKEFVPPFDGTKPLMEGNPDRFQAIPQRAAASAEDEQSLSSFGGNVDFGSSAAAPDPDEDSENTVPLGGFAKKGTAEDVKESRPFARDTYEMSSSTEVQGAFNRGEPRVSPSSAYAPSAESSLKQSENLRVAQARINSLEQELEHFRRENEKLASAGETMRRRADDLIARAETAEAQARESKAILDEEKKVLRGQLQARDRDNQEMKGRLEEMELRLESNFKKIRVRERELEHRLEIIKMESTTLVSAKDKMILELKRQIDQLAHESEHGKQKTQELFNQYKEKQETIRRVVRALRIALTILEGDEENVVPIKKAE